MNTHAQQWMCSSKGKRAISNALAVSKTAIKELEKKRRIPHESLHKPVTR